MSQGCNHAVNTGEDQICYWGPRPPQCIDTSLIFVVVPVHHFLLAFSISADSICLCSLGQCQVATPQCRIQKCTTDFVSLTSHLTSTVDGFHIEFCKALRAYSACTQRTAKSCRGNLVFHSAVLGISDLMSQRNCSRDGPTSSTHPEIHHEPCNYHSRTQHAHAHSHLHAHSQAHSQSHSRPVYLFCGLFGDPHLRTFKDSFQTCKVEGAWPLIDNDYLSVQVTNVPVVTGSSATATNKVRKELFGRGRQTQFGFLGCNLLLSCFQEFLK